jgi:hypothetical protein
MTKKGIGTRGPAFATGGLRRPKEYLVDWPQESPDAQDSASDVGPPSVDPEDPRLDAQAQLARAKHEIVRLLGRVQELSAENERLRRELESLRGR